MTGASKVLLLTKLIGLFGEVEATARRARQAAEHNCKSPFSQPSVIGYEVECVTILQTLDHVRDVLRQLK